MLRSVLAAAFALIAAPSFSEESGLPTGLWQVRIFTPVPTPELKNDEQVFRICYDQAAVKSHMNPVLPKAEAAKCRLDFTDMGDVAYDATCRDGDHRLRISEAADGLWRGTYRFVGNKGGAILEPAVELKRIAETCD
ncbi:hypothetical protein [Rhizobium sp. L43]|uniref:hypothetical protein n=1 Tax=Rhizobium sp. L43 TaxID=2035452 RepID=UPI000BE8C070|nr:hypothetical protein [Rhizobium sp. L43]PDS75668.1 hypothetical protein CO667_25610 [Rhizobium sp. L43]